jgi:hypothetical protein
MLVGTACLGLWRTNKGEVGKVLYTEVRECPKRRGQVQVESNNRTANTIINCLVNRDWGTPCQSVVKSKKRLSQGSGSGSSRLLNKKVASDNVCKHTVETRTKKTEK